MTSCVFPPRLMLPSSDLLREFMAGQHLVEGARRRALAVSVADPLPARSWTSGNVIVEVDGELPPHGSHLQEMTRRNVAGGAQCLVREEVNRRTSGAVVRDRNEARDGNAVLIALDPGPVMAAVDVHQPLAQRSNDRHSSPRMAVGKLLCIREVEEPEVLRRHDRLLDDSPHIVESGVGASAVVGYRNRLVGVQRDVAVPRCLIGSFVSGVGNHFENQMQHATRSKVPWALTNVCEVIEVHPALPLMCCVLPLRRSAHLLIVPGGLIPVMDTLLERTGFEASAGQLQIRSVAAWSSENDQNSVINPSSM
jgi:hypothetical protein